MIGTDDWCINYDKIKRMCKIYDTRPEFCKVEPKKYEKMYDIKADELNVSIIYELDVSFLVIC